MRILTLSLLVWLTCPALAHATQSAPPDICGDPRISIKLIDKTVTARGKFSLYGKQGPVINCNGESVYLLPRVPRKYGKDWVKIEGKTIIATGMLHFAPGTKQPRPAEQGFPPYYFFYEDTAKILLDGKEWTPTTINTCSEENAIAVTKSDPVVNIICKREKDGCVYKAMPAKDDPNLAWYVTSYVVGDSPILSSISINCNVLHVKGAGVWYNRKPEN